MSIQAAAEQSGYNTQYLRRLARAGAIEGINIGQMWRVEIVSLGAYLESVQKRADCRYGPPEYQDYLSERRE